MLRLILVRHGESEADMEPVRIEGAADFPLTPRGLWQVERLGERIAREYQVDEILTSPLQRARQTAEAIGRASGRPVTTEPRLRERSHGIFGGLTPDEARARYGPLPWEVLKPHQAPPEGESFLQQAARVAEFWSELHHSRTESTVCIVSHGGTLNCLYQAALKLPPDEFGIVRNPDTGLHEWNVYPGGRVLIRLASCARHLLGTGEV